MFEDLIYRFLLKAGYTRASILQDISLVAPGGTGYRPSFVIVDPETGDRLAAIQVVDAVDADTLQARAADVGDFARRLGGVAVQGFIVRVDPDADPDAGQVQFYQCWPNQSLRQLTVQGFPDLDALRALRRLKAPPRAVAPSSAPLPAPTPAVPEARHPFRHLRDFPLWPAGVLAALAVLDGVLRAVGESLLSASQALLLVAAAVLVTLVLGGRRSPE